MVRWFLIVLLVVLQVLMGTPDFLADGPYWMKALLYSFFHGNWFHLAVNVLAVSTIYREPVRPCRDLLMPFVIAVLVYPLSFRPVVGFSNVLYATIGMRTPSLKDAWWRRPAVAVFLLVTVALVLVPRFSATTHIAAFMLGTGCSAMARWYKELTKDARRYL